VELLAFDVGGHACVLGISLVREIVTVPHVTRVPGAPAALRGLVNLRGQVVPVVDVAVRLGGWPSRVAHGSALLRVDARVAGTGTPCALLVDAVLGLVEADAHAISPRPPTGPLASADAVAGFVLAGARTLLLLDLDRLLDREVLHRQAATTAIARADLEMACPEPVPAAAREAAEAEAATAAAKDLRAASATRAETPPAKHARGGLQAAGAGAAPRAPLLRASAGPPAGVGRRPGLGRDPAAGAAERRAPFDAAPVRVGHAVQPPRPRPLARFAPHPSSATPKASPQTVPAATPAAQPDDAVPGPAHVREEAPAPARLVAARVREETSAGGRSRRGLPVASIAVALACGLAAWLLARGPGAVEEGERARATRRTTPSSVETTRWTETEAAAAAPSPTAATPPPATTIPIPSAIPIPPPTPSPIPPPTARAAPASPRAAPAAAPSPIVEAPLLPGHRTVVVRPGDTLWALARRYRHDPYSWPVLYRANGEQVRDPDLILPGQRLAIPDAGAR
jgi:chemotaxis signal transduction protein